MLEKRRIERLLVYRRRSPALGLDRDRVRAPDHASVGHVCDSDEGSLANNR